MEQTGVRGRISLGGVSVHDLGAERCGIVTFVVPGVGPDLVKARLAERRINVTVTGTAGTRLDMETRRLADLVRASVHRCNAEGELERFGQEIESLSTVGRLIPPQPLSARRPWRSPSSSPWPRRS